MAERALHASNTLLQALTEAQLEFIGGSDAHLLFDKLLTVLLELTESEYGFIGEVLRDAQGTPSLRSHALTHELRDLQTLFGRVLTTGEPLVANEPNPHAGGLPAGHPPLNALLGLPLKSGDELVGLVGIANRPGGYGPELIEFLQPFVATCCSIILGRRGREQQKHTEELLRQREEELQRHRDHLEELVQSRTESLLHTTVALEERQAQLLHSERMASLGQLVAGIAHEINNPLGYITSNLATLTQYLSVFTGLLKLHRELADGLGPELQGPRAELLERIRSLEQQEDLDYILGDVNELLSDSREGAHRVADIVQSLKAFVREDSKQPELVDVNKELATTLKVVWNQLKYRCEVKCDYAQVPPILGRPAQLNQVFTHLLLNAVQAIPERGVIHVTTLHEGDEVLVRISDTGHGMTPEVLSKIFSPFFTTKPPGKGAGLGLSISEGIITSHKGRIEVQSQFGQGSTFTVRLPVAKDL
ncbi:phospho-acceptor domain-containing protein [Archangium gephyra]|uniref:histidine kinase n=1 Tax=Archangium gephyra TaxID=48 RepID=A0AAC8TI28_9BACT|nr:Signal transduction histidine kinase [Archangium gephyra]REG35856.1 phospho-acceptor domain-containing protein [Archangium gephyra]